MEDKLTILDISVEDDSLLPGPKNVGNAEVRADQVPKPVKFRRSRTAGHGNLRKSLAWDKAFLTGEGVLDADELPTCTQTPKELPQLPPLSKPNAAVDQLLKPAERLQAVQEESTDLLKENRIISNFRSCSERFDVSRSVAAQEEIDTVAQKDQNYQMKSSSSVAGPIVARPLPAKKVIESAIQKGTRLRLPSAFPSKQAPDKILTEQLLLKQQQKGNGSSFSKVSKKVKDTLGRVLPGHNRITKNESLSSSLTTTTTENGSHLQSGRSSSFREIGSAPVHHVRARGEGVSISKWKETKGEDINARPKPTGLRIPSPKLGFFEPARTTRFPQQQQQQQQQQRLKPHGLPTGRSTQFKPSTSIPSAPHLRSCDRQRGRIPVSAPSTPPVRSYPNDGILEEDTSKAAVELATSTADVNGIDEICDLSNGSLVTKSECKKEEEEEEEEEEKEKEEDDEAEKEEEEGEEEEKEEEFEAEVKEEEKEQEQEQEIEEVKDAEEEIVEREEGKEEEKSPSHWSDWPVLSAITTKKSFIVCDVTDSVPFQQQQQQQQQQQKEKSSSLFALAKRAVGRLSPSVGQENDNNSSSRHNKRERSWMGDNESRIPSSKLPFPQHHHHNFTNITNANIDEQQQKIRLVTSCPVQHSPPNKTPPQPGPWSPVKKNEQPGPFDCTKKKHNYSDFT